MSEFNEQDFLRNLLTPSSSKQPQNPFGSRPIDPSVKSSISHLFATKKDLKSPLSKKWNFSFLNSVKRKINTAKRTKLKRRINNIEKGLTMPDPLNLPIGSAKNMNAAILFFDIVNFTYISSRRTQEEVLLLLNIIIPQLMYVVRHWNGEIEKNTGDGIMAIFGTETRNDFLIASDTIEAAMALRYIMLNEINSVLLQEGLPTIDFRIGIDMGKVLISRIGIINNNFLAAVGDAVNRAAKLESMAKKNGVCLGDELHRNLHTDLHPYCREGSHPQWNWKYKATGSPYRFFHFTKNWPELNGAFGRRRVELK